MNLGFLVFSLRKFGSHSDDGVVLENKEAGHLLRTKSAKSNEGGVASGFAVVDSPLLI